MVKYIVVCGGVISGIGKGVIGMFCPGLWSKVMWNVKRWSEGSADTY